MRRPHNVAVPNPGWTSLASWTTWAVWLITITEKLSRTRPLPSQAKVLIVLFITFVLENAHEWTWRQTGPFPPRYIHIRSQASKYWERNPRGLDSCPPHRSGASRSYP